MNGQARRVVALCGGVGGAKLAYGLDRILGGRLTLIVNTGDDFEHLGLAICPDLDTVVYTLSQLADDQRGWGRAGESWNFMEALGELGGDVWFRLGDRDLALHILRSRALRAGRSLTEFTRDLAMRLQIRATILPMTDTPFSTVVVTPGGRLPFQRYFVEFQAQPEVRAIEFESIGAATAAEGVLRAIRQADAIILCPSNPYLSIDPILAVPGMLPALQGAAAPIIAVSPLVGGQAIKGPTAKIMRELGVETSCISIARHYPFLDGLVMDKVDEADAPRIDVPVHLTQTVMRSKDERVRLAQECLDFLGHFCS